MMDDDTSRANLILAIARLREAMVSLFAVIHPNLSRDLGHAVDEFDEKVKRLTDASRSVAGGMNQSPRPRQAPFRDAWGVLKSLADRALVAGHELRCLYDLGAALGELRLRLWDWGPGSVLDVQESEDFSRWVDAGGEDPQPDLRPLVQAALRLPRELVPEIPPLETLVGLAPHLGGAEQGHSLEQLLAKHPELCRRYEVGREVDHAIVSSVADMLDKAIQDGLTRVVATIAPPAVVLEGLTPRWDKDGNLWAGSLLIKHFEKQATSIRKLLDALENSGWQRPLPNPFAEGPYPEKLRETKRSLNKRQPMIRFEITGDNPAITWDWAVKR